MLAFMPEAVADATLAILGRPSPAEQQVSPDLARLLGRPPGTFGDWAARSAAAFRYDRGVQAELPLSLSGLVTA
jgi:hypothetical protein